MSDDDEAWLNETGKLAVKLMADARGVDVFTWLRDAVTDQIYREAGAAKVDPKLVLAPSSNAIH